MITPEVNQSRLKGGQRMPRKLIEKTLRAVANEKKEKKNKRVSIAFVSEKEIRELNKRYRGKNYVTDVLSFSMDDEELLGELILSYEQAQRQAIEMKHSTRDELTFLIVHGTLHLYGHDHEEEREAKKMFAHQEKILKKLGVNPRI